MNKIINFNIKKNINSKQNLFNGTCALKLEEKPDNDTELFIFDSLQQNEPVKFIYKEGLMPRETHIIDEYGNHFPRWSWIDNPRLQAKPYDQYNKFHYFYHRDYSQTMRHFTSPDPAEPDIYNPITFNEYLAMNNNPIKYNDPTGEDITVVAWDWFTNPDKWTVLGRRLSIGFPHVGVIIDMYDKKGNKIGAEYFEFEPAGNITEIFKSGLTFINSIDGYVSVGQYRGGGKKRVIKTTMQQDIKAYNKAMELQRKENIKYSYLGPIKGGNSYSCMSFVGEVLKAADVNRQKREKIKELFKMFKEVRIEVHSMFNRYYTYKKFW